MGKAENQDVYEAAQAFSQGTYPNQRDKMQNALEEKQE